MDSPGWQQQPKMMLFARRTLTEVCRRSGGGLVQPPSMMMLDRANVMSGVNKRKQVKQPMSEHRSS